MTATQVDAKNRYAAPTDKQFAYAESLARKGGYRFGVADARKAMRGKNPVGSIKRSELSELIDWLKNRTS